MFLGMIPLPGTLPQGESHGAIPDLRMSETNKESPRGTASHGVVDGG